MSLGSSLKLVHDAVFSVWPVVDEADHLVGAVSVDDVLDQMMPIHWRDLDDDDADRLMARSFNG